MRAGPQIDKRPLPSWPPSRLNLRSASSEAARTTWKIVVFSARAAKTMGCQRTMTLLPSNQRQIGHRRGEEDPSLQPVAPGTDPISIFVLACGATSVLFYRKNLHNNRRNSRDASAGLFYRSVHVEKISFLGTLDRHLDCPLASDPLRVGF